MALKLNLSSATEGGDFDPLPADTYPARVFAAEMRETKGGGKLPAGTPMINVQFQITGDKYNNRRVFRSFAIAPDGYENKDKMDGILYSFLKALGYESEELKSDDFELDLDDLSGRECSVVVGQREYEGTIQNEVRAVRPAKEGDTSGLLL